MNLLFAFLLAVIPLISSPDMEILPGSVGIPIRLHGSEVGSVSFDLFYSGDLEFSGYEFELGEPFLGGCSDFDYFVRCEVFGYLSGWPFPEIPSGEIFTLYFEVSDSAYLSFENFTFENIHGQSILGNSSAGRIDIIDPFRVMLPALFR